MDTSSIQVLTSSRVYYKPAYHLDEKEKSEVIQAKSGQYFRQ